MEYAHRFVYWAMRGPPRLPLTWDTAVIIHLCDKAGCMNPLHMRWGTQDENLHYVLPADMWAEGGAIVG